MTGAAILIFDSFEENGSSSRIRISWEGAKIRGRARRVNWDGRIKLSGPLLLKAEPFAFDSPADGIVSTNNTEVVFKSSTVGDVDGVDLFLDRADSGTVTFESNIGEVSINLTELGVEQKVFDFGELGLMVKVQRYPEELKSDPLSLEWTVDPVPGECNAYLIKAVQEDGQIGWTSPIYVVSE